MKRARLLLLTAFLFPLTAPPGSGQENLRFGTSVAVGDGELIVGEVANWLRPGTVYVYGRGERGGWEEVALLRGPGPEVGDGFGASLALAGSSLFVAQGGEVRLFDREVDGSWRMTGTLQAPSVREEEDFGASLAAEGDWLLVGAPFPEPSGAASSEGEPGSVYAFRRGDDGDWVEAARLQASDAIGANRFGAALSMSEGMALVGAPFGEDRSGVTYSFRLDSATGEWSEVARLQPSAPQAGEGFGFSVAMQGGLAVVGAPERNGSEGAAYVYRYDEEEAWTQHARLGPFAGGPQARFGTAVGVDGHDVWVGAPSGQPLTTGSAYVFRTRDDGPAFGWAQRMELADSNPDDDLGQRIAVAAGIALVAATGKDHDAGSVAVYTRDGSDGWREDGLLEARNETLPRVVGQEVECDDGMAGPFECDGAVSLLSFLPVEDLVPSGSNRGTRVNDIWGWYDEETEREYALVGRIDGLSIVDVTDPVNPVLIGDLPKTPGGPPSPTWRDMKVYQDHVYVVADGAGAHGMQVLDLTQVRDVTDPPVVFEPTYHYTGVNSTHDIVINGETGYAYIVGGRAGGETCGSGLHMLDIQEPASPVFVGCFNHEGTGRGGGGYTHDAQCVIWRGPDERYHGREICLGANEDAISIADVTDKSNPVAVGVGRYPNAAYTHQGWLTEDQHYWFVNDEGDELAGTVGRTRTLVWDLSDLEDPQLALEYMGTTSASDHNLYIKGDLMYQSNYRAGLRIIDISDPLDPHEVGWLDTAPFLDPEPGFSGSWSNYPFFRSGAIGVTSVHEGLFLVRYRDPSTVFE